MARARMQLGKLSMKLERISDSLEERAKQIVSEFAHDGEKDMEQIIEHAITPTGLRRAARKPNPFKDPADIQSGSTSPGRIDTGLMINSVNSEVESEHRLHIGRFGWTQEVEDYFLAQENGTDKIQAMHALLGAFLKQRELAFAKINAAVGRGK